MVSATSKASARACWHAVESRPGKLGTPAAADGRQVRHARRLLSASLPPWLLRWGYAYNPGYYGAYSPGYYGGYYGVYNPGYYGDEVPIPSTPSFNCECEQCGERVWVAHSSPIEPIRMCVLEQRSTRRPNPAVTLN